MHEVKAIIRPERLDDVVEALHEIPDLPGITVSTVQGYGTRVPAESGAPLQYGETTLTKVEIVVPDALLPRVLETIQRTARTGRPGDGKIFVMSVEAAVRIRTGERGTEAV